MVAADGVEVECEVRGEELWRRRGMLVMSPMEVETVSGEEGGYTKFHVFMYRGERT